VSALSWGFVVVGVVALCLLVGFSLAFKLDFVLIGLVVVVALATTYLAGRMDKRKSRGPWAKDSGDS
jgi:Mn2+/Fe2+ NRAMP family transporter